MSLSFSDCFQNLLCAEDSAALSIDSPADCSSDLESPATSSDEDSIAGFIDEERNFVPGVDYLAELRSLSVDLSDRTLSVAWMLKVQAFYGFQPLTAYLAVNYFDRFLCSHRLPQTNGWPLQLLSVACLSLAAKMEELLVPSLIDFQVEDAKYVFEPKMIQRMELLILGVLDWKLRSVTPFIFIGFFANKLDKTGTFAGFLISSSTDIILSNLQGDPHNNAPFLMFMITLKKASMLEYSPSSIAAAAVLCAASEIPKLSLVTPEHAESWCDGLSKESVKNCYRLMQQYIMESGREKAAKTLPQLRVMSRTRRVRSTNCSSSDFSSSFSSCSSSSSTTQTYNIKKRRKLNNLSWVDLDGDKISSD